MNYTLEIITVDSQDGLSNLTNPDGCTLHKVTFVEVREHTDKDGDINETEYVFAIVWAKPCVSTHN